MQASQESVAYQIKRFVALTLLFGVLNYTGTALYFTADGITTVKPFSGVALALLLINGRSWLWPVLISGTVGAMIAKVAFYFEPAIITIPLITSGALFLVYHFSRNGSAKRSIFGPGNSWCSLSPSPPPSASCPRFPTALGARLWNGHQILAICRPGSFPPPCPM